MVYIIYHTISGFLGARLHQADGGPPVQPWRGEQHNCNHQLEIIVGNIRIKSSTLMHYISLRSRS